MWAADALELQLAIYGEGAIETAEYLEQAGECALWAASAPIQRRVPRPLKKLPAQGCLHFGPSTSSQQRSSGHHGPPRTPDPGHRLILYGRTTPTGTGTSSAFAATAG